MMKIGVPKEIKKDEYRVALVPAGVEALKKAGHTILIETQAGIGSGISDVDYEEAGAISIQTREEIFNQADMIIKVKEPLPEEYPLLREGQLLYTYLHLAADKKLTDAMLERKITGIAYETVADTEGRLPLLAPMSEVAGRLAAQEGAKYLEKPFGGKGVLLGGVPGVMPAKVLVLGGGIVGTNAAMIAAGMGAEVIMLDINIERLRQLDEIMPKNVKTLYSSSMNIRNQLPDADLIIGAVLIPGAKAPKLITRDMLKLMQHGSVLVDVAIDQGGCFETSKPTTHTDPVYDIDGIAHYCVANMPGAVSRTSTFALTNATLSYALKLAEKGLDAIREDAALLQGLNVHAGKLTCRAVAEAFDYCYTPPKEALG